MDSTQATSSPRTFGIADLRALVKSGKLRIPQFQRSFRWEQRDVISLFDSLLKGYPIGTLLLWKRRAEAAHLNIGALEVDAPETPDALWVVDGQQRITSLVNAVDPLAASDPRFALGFDLANQRITPLGSRSGGTTIPLHSLLGLGDAFAWLRDHSEAEEYATRIENLQNLLSGFSIHATIMENTEEAILREVFDRINTRGKSLNAAEIFDAIHGGQDTRFTTGGLSQSIDARTLFGRLDAGLITQALLVRRNPIIARDIHLEFESSRRPTNDFPNEERDAAFVSTEHALIHAIQFLQNHCGVPHITFLPFRFQLLTLTRFFSLFPGPHERNLELLSRWFWRTSSRAKQLGITGGERDLRRMAQCVLRDEESQSVQRLLSSVGSTDSSPYVDLSSFSPIRSDSRVVLLALWSRGPFDFEAMRTMTRENLSESLIDERTPRSVIHDLAPSTALSSTAKLAANKILSFFSPFDLDQYSEDEAVLQSHLLNESIVSKLRAQEFDQAIEERARLLASFLEDFINAKSAVGQEDTPPLDEFIFDAEIDCHDL